MAINPKTSISEIDENHRLVEFVVSFSEMDKLFEKNVSEFRKQVSMKGFRPGQVPKQLFVSRFGDEVYRETVEKVVSSDLRSEFEKIVEAWKADEKLEIAAPAEHGELEAERGQDLVYKLKIALNKPLVLQDYKDLGVKASAVVVSEEEINDAIASLRERFGADNVDAEDQDKLRTRVTDNILGEKRFKARQIALKEAFDKVIEKNPFPVLEEQIKFTAERSLQRRSDEEIEISEEQLNSMRPEIIRAIQEERILRAIIEQEALKPTQGQVDARVQEIADSMQMDFSAVKDAMRKNGQINRIRENLKIDLAQNILIDETMPEHAQEQE